MRLLGLLNSVLLATRLPFEKPNIEKRNALIMTLDDEIRRATAILTRHTTFTKNSSSALY